MYEYTVPDEDGFGPNAMIYVITVVVLVIVALVSGNWLLPEKDAPTTTLQAQKQELTDYWGKYIGYRLKFEQFGPLTRGDGSKERSHKLVFKQSGSDVVVYKDEDRSTVIEFSSIGEVEITLSKEK